MSKDLTGKIVEIAQARRRFGYRRIHDMLRPEFPAPFSVDKPVLSGTQSTSSTN